MTTATATPSESIARISVSEVAMLAWPRAAVPIPSPEKSSAKVASRLESSSRFLEKASGKMWQWLSITKTMPPHSFIYPGINWGINFNKTTSTAPAPSPSAINVPVRPSLDTLVGRAYNLLALNRPTWTNSA